MAPRTTKVGPGTFTVGDTAEMLDVSQQVKSLTITWESDKEDDDNVLSGDVIGGEVTFTAKVTGTVNQDLVEGGFVEKTWNEKGNVVPFKYVPNSEAGATVNGRCILTPLDIGGDVKTRATAEFEFDCEGEPTLTFGSGV